MVLWIASRRAWRGMGWTGRTRNEGSHERDSREEAGRKNTTEQTRRSKKYEERDPVEGVTIADKMGGLHASEHSTHAEVYIVQDDRFREGWAR